MRSWFSFMQLPVSCGREFFAVLAVMVLLGLPLHACLRRCPEILARLAGK